MRPAPGTRAAHDVRLTHLDEAALADLSAGAVLLATGGGGDPHVAQLNALRAVREHGPVRLLPVSALADDALVAAIGGSGAPVVELELLPTVENTVAALAVFEEHLGRRVDALVSFEVGGANSLIPIIAAAVRNVPVVDGDGMGRALPEAQMMTYALAGVPPTPAIAYDYAGNAVTFTTSDTATYERHVRALAAKMGGLITTIEHPMSGAQLKRCIVPDTISFSIELGRVLRGHGDARGKFGALAALFRRSPYGPLCHVQTGKVADYRSRTVGGFDVGGVLIESFAPGWAPLRIDVKNEFLLARRGDDVVACVPDLIMLVDLETGAPINAERLRYGQRVAVLAAGCPPHYLTPAALQVVGPKCFGFDLDHIPLAELTHLHQPLGG